MSDTDAVSQTVAARLWVLAKKESDNAPLLRQAYSALVAQKAILGQVVKHANAMGYEGGSIEGACTFLQGLAEDSQKNARGLALAKQKLADVAILLHHF